MRDENGDYIICETTGKRCYSSKDADYVLSRTHLHKGSKVRPKRKYYCEYCKYYHLTSKSFSHSYGRYSSARRKKKYIKTLW